MANPNLPLFDLDPTGTAGNAAPAPYDELVSRAEPVDHNWDEPARLARRSESQRENQVDIGTALPVADGDTRPSQETRDRYTFRGALARAALRETVGKPYVPTPTEEQ